MCEQWEDDQWELTGQIHWKLKDGIPRTISCEYCHGTGKVGGGFGDMDGPRDCPRCFGHGNKINPEINPKPKVPDDLHDHLHKAWIEYFEMKRGC